MKEVTRVHIAKTTYEMEVEAKKALAAYLDTIKQYTGDDELVSDVEVRIVELLGERGIKKNRVVMHEDIDAITGQLGAPEEFAEDGDIVSGPSETAPSNKKLYRDSGNAWIGGIAAGLARYYATRAWWIRVLFAVSVLLTSGFSLLIYLLLWLVLPATKTGSDVLRLEGKPVTTSRTSTDTDLSVRPNRDRCILRAVSTIAGVLLLVAAIGAMAIAIIALFAFGFSGDAGRLSNAIVSPDALPWAIWSALALAVFGLALSLLVAYMLISWNFTKAVIIATCAMLALTIASGMSGIAAAYVGQRQINEQLSRMTETRTVTAPSLTGVTSLKLISNAASSDVTYVVSPETPKISSTVFKGTKDPTVTVDGTSATITVRVNAVQPPFGYFPSRVTIYGPALSRIDVSDGSSLSIRGNGTSQDSLALSAGRASNISVDGLRVRSVTSTQSENANLDLTGASVTDATVKAEGVSTAGFATIANLTLDVPETCASASSGNSLFTTQTVTSQKITLNGRVIDASRYSSPCVVIQSDAPVIDE